MNDKLITVLKQEVMGVQEQQIRTTLTLLEEGNTIPFIARYRKEMTGSLDEVQIKQIQDRYQYLVHLEQRKEEVIRLIDEQGKLTDELKEEIEQAQVLQHVEDVYRPYKQKRRTKATIAKEQGLQPFADYLLSFPVQDSILETANQYVNEELGVLTVADVLLGAHEIIAETVGDEADYRKWIRSHMLQDGVMKTTEKKEHRDEKKVYEMYYDFSEPVKKLVAHRVLAINRAEKEGVIKVELEVDEPKIFAYLGKSIIEKHHQSPSAPYVIAAYEDGYNRFIKPALDREVRNELSAMAEEQAIKVFGANLRNLLLQAPLKDKIVLGFDPAYRTGCKLAVVDTTGKVLAISVIYPHPPASQEKRERAERDFLALIDKYQVEMVAIGNGTASRESEVFVASALKKCSRKVYYVIVNEAGASVYSASEIARKEFPDLEVEQRSAVSIARRIQDPLSELVKIDPKSVGVGQYQHDVTQKKLEEALGFVVETAVNQVGVDVNTASPQLLTYVSGLSKQTAQNIVTYRDEHGAFSSRDELKKVPRLGPKAYEQAIGFLRIPHAQNVFDQTGIHPESYKDAYLILDKLSIKQSDLGTEEARNKIAHATLPIAGVDVGMETMKDIIDALMRPGRDFRDEMSAPLLRSDVLTLEDLKPGMELQGTVRNVVDFGVFVDIGVKQDGLVHISKLSKNFVKHPMDVVSVGDIVKVWIVDVDYGKQRVQLSMIQQ